MPADKLDARLCRDWAMPDLTGVPIVRGDARPGQRSHPANQGVRP
jgi:hypothetical protein